MRSFCRALVVMLTFGFAVGTLAAADPIRMGIATDITGAIAPSGNSNWQVAQFAVEQINKWVWGAGKKLPGLVKRREAESVLMFGGSES